MPMPLGHCGQLTSAPNVWSAGFVGRAGGAVTLGVRVRSGNAGTMSPLPSVVGAPGGPSPPGWVDEPVAASVAGPDELRATDGAAVGASPQAERPPRSPSRATTSAAPRTLPRIPRS